MPAKPSLSWGARNRPVMGALKPAIFEEIGIRHLAFSIPQLKEIRDGEPTHNGSNQRACVVLWAG
jgi:hypothetical protein